MVPTRASTNLAVTDLAVLTRKADVLDRVAADLALGHTQPAIQRLSSLVDAHSTDLDLRQRLAAAHRQVGNPVEAGRWGYLSAETEPAEISAFERAYPSPAARLRRLNWPEPREPGVAVPGERDAATAFARDRLARLAAASSARRRPARPRRRWLMAIATAVAAPFAVLGAITVVQWIVG
jgi:hypothetical protein